MARVQSGLRNHFDVKLTDGTHLDIQTIPFDAIRWERRSKKTFSESGGSAEMMTFLAYTAAHRLKLTNESELDGFASKIEEIYVLDDEDEDQDEDPTPADSPMEDRPS